MACKIPYLDNNYQGEQLKELRQKHINIVKEVISSKLFYRIDGKLQLSIDKNSPIRKQQEEFVAKYPELSIVKKSTNEPVLYSKATDNTQTLSETDKKSIKDLAERMSARIGIPVVFEDDESIKYKGKLENGTAYVNLAYATKDTPIHEILGHPIIRAIKKSESFLYSSLLKELETGRGKEVFDRIKRDYISKQDKFNFNMSEYEHYLAFEQDTNLTEDDYTDYIFDKYGKNLKYVVVHDFLQINALKQKGYKEVDYIKDNESKNSNYKGYVYTKTDSDYYVFIKNENTKYTLEEQQEEAIVELLGLMTADKLDKVKDGKLISLLKRLLKEIKSFVKSLLNQKEVEIDKLPDNMTLGDIADLLAYSNSKLILPGYEVIYTTPDNQKFKTYAEASNHISNLAKSVEYVDLKNVKINTSIPDSFEVEVLMGEDEPSNILKFTRENGQWYISDNWTGKNKIEESEVIKYYQDSSGNYFGAKQNNINSFIENNKQYEQSKEIIEEWKRVNNIVYNPEEVYSRGQEFVSVVGAYSDFDVNLMMQNLLQHIEDNEKAGGKFAISAFTKPVDKTIGHLEGGGGKIKFKIYPQPKDILWASNIDAYSGSVWDASEKVNKDKKSELLGVSYTKYPSLSNINTVQPNLANIIDNLQHHHNELGISLTGNNFRLEYDSDIPYQTKKIIDGINSILDQKYGKLVKPEIKKYQDFSLNKNYDNFNIGNDNYQIKFYYDDWEFGVESYLKNGKKISPEEYSKAQSLYRKQDLSIQPTQTNKTLKESIESFKNKVLKDYSNFKDLSGKTLVFKEDGFENNKIGDIVVYNNNNYKIVGEVKENSDFPSQWQLELQEKEYTSQALINTKIAALKEVAKKYPRSLIRSEVKLKNNFDYDDSELMFQKIPSNNIKEGVDFVFEENPELANIGSKQDYSEYLDTIFKTSKVKDIVYHNSPNKFDKFDKLKVGSNTSGLGSEDRFLGIFFTSDKKAYEGFNIKGFQYASLLNITNPKNGGINYNNLPDLKTEEDFKNYQKQLIRDKYDGISYGKAFLDMEEGGYMNPILEAVVFEPEQIHILSSKKDLEMFRDFINFTKSEYAKYGDIQQFRDYIMSKNFATIEEFLVVNNKIDRKC